MFEDEKSIKEKRIRATTQSYYCRPEIQKAIFEFSQNREVAPRYFEGFGKRPDTFQYPGDIFELVKKGATSFHCSEELWSDVLSVKTGMSEKELNELRIGWDLLIDIDCKWFDYSKKAAEAVIMVLEQNGVKNFGIKFSGSKGFHILVPFKAFPKEVNGVQTSNLFPELPRKIAAYIRFFAEKNLKEILPEDFQKDFKNVQVKKGIKCNSCNEIAEEYNEKILVCPSCSRKEEKIISVSNTKKEANLKCPDCGKEFEVLAEKPYYRCKKCGKNSQSDKNNFSRTVETDLFEIMGFDIVLVSPRHLFRMPYSLHEKTALASIVISKSELKNFDMKDASPEKIKIKDFMPESEEGEATQLVLKSLDWYKENNLEEKFFSSEEKNLEFKPIKIENLSDKHFSPSIKKILEGVKDGRKRATFVLINYFRAIGMEKPEIEKILYEWNEKNEVPLKKGYIQSQISWAFRNKIILPPNFDKDYYKALGVNPTDEEIRLKNPVTYTTKKFFEGKEYDKKQKKEKSEKINSF